MPYSFNSRGALATHRRRADGFRSNSCDVSCRCVLSEPRITRVFIGRSADDLIARSPGTAHGQGREFRAAKAPPLWGERVRADAAGESAPGWGKAGWARFARPDPQRDA